MSTIPNSRWIALRLTKTEKYESPNPLTGTVEKVKAPDDGYVVFNQNASLFISNDQLAAIDKFRMVAPGDDAQQTLPAVEDHMQVLDAERVYRCGCKSKRYTSTAYDKWLDTMSRTKEPVESQHYKCQRRTKVPMDFPDGWGCGTCSDCGQVISKVDFNNTPSDNGGKDG